MAIQEFVHVGYPKAASTTLQNNVFAHHPEICYLGIDPVPNNVGDRAGSRAAVGKPYRADAEIRKFHRRLVSVPTSAYDEDRESQIWANLRKKWSTEESQNAVVLSNERILSVYYAFDDLQQKACRVAEVFNDPLILIVIRNQKDIIRSQYRDQPFDPRDLEEGRPVQFDEWFRLLREDKRYIRSLKYNRIVRMYEERFGESNVHVVPFEKLVDDVERTAMSLYEWMNVESDGDLYYNDRYENPSPSAGYFVYKKMVRSPFGQALSQLLPEMVKKNINRLSKSVLSDVEKKEVEVGTSIANVISDIYSSGNRSLSDRYGLGLEKYGY